MCLHDPLCTDILDRKGHDWRPFRGDDAPPDPPPGVRNIPVVTHAAVEAPDVPKNDPPSPGDVPHGHPLRIAELLDALMAVPDRKKKNGSGRAAALIARQFAVSQATVYQARSILKRGSPELVQALRQGELTIKAAYTSLPKDKTPETLRAG